METGNTETNATNGDEITTTKKVESIYKVLEVTEESGIKKKTSALQTSQGCVIEVVTSRDFNVSENENHTEILTVSLVFVPAVRLVENEDGSFILS